MKVLVLFLVVFALFLSACGGGGSTPTVGNAPTLSVSVNPSTINKGEITTLTALTTNALEVDISGLGTFSASSGRVDVSVSPLQTTRYAVVARGPGGSTSTEITLLVIPYIPHPNPAAPPTVILVPSNSQIEVSWSSVSSVTDGGTLLYNVYYSTVPTVDVLTGTKILAVTSPYTQTGLVNTIPYYFFVTAVERTVGGSLFESVPSVIVSATPTPLIYSRDVTVTWLLPTTYTDNTLIAVGDISRIVVAVYMNTTGTVPWGTPIGVSIPGATTGTWNLSIIQGTTYYFTATASLDGGVSDFCIPISHVWN